jgi:hypothetical protein
MPKILRETLRRTVKFVLFIAVLAAAAYGVQRIAVDA